MKSDNSSLGEKFKRAVIGCSTVLTLAVLAVVGLFKGCGASFSLFSNGSGTNSDASSSSESQESSEVTQEAITDSETTEITEEAVTIIEVTVSGSEYIYENSTIGLDDLINELKEINGKFIVEIKDDNSSKKAYDALKAKLESNNISYSE
ncbi:MAG: hypothetical protein IJL67_14625 [Oscillospiraceae bacterium]|nr:hypothetical protein [Oscillospiraceae bacterium]